MKKDNTKLWLLSALLALPGLALVIALFVNKDMEIMHFLIGIAFELIYGFMFAYAVTGMVSLHRFFKANPSYKNYSTKKLAILSYASFAVFIIFFIFKIVIYIVEFGKEDYNSFYIPIFVAFYLPSVFANFCFMSDENLYIGMNRESVPIEKIRADDPHTLDAEMNRYDDYVEFKFHVDDIAYRPVLSRSLLVELCKVLPGVNRNYSRTPNPKKNPQKFY